MAPPVKKIRKQIKIGSGANAIRESATFTSQREATQWLVRRKAELLDKVQGLEGNKKSLLEAMRRYADEVAPTHRGARWEQVRLQAFETHLHLPLNKPIAQITPQQISRWREWRESKVQSGSVRREMSLLGSVFSTAQREWHWITSSPMSSVRRPPPPPPSNRTISRYEIKQMLRSLGYRWRKRPASMKELTAYAFLLALRTGMRMSEITGMSWDRVHTNWIELETTKNGDSREVPLSGKAARLLLCLKEIDEDRPLPITSQSVDAIFRKARDKAELAGFTFHATRHTAATWIGSSVGRPGRLSFPQFCAMFGWRDPKNAMIYVNPRAQDLAHML
jgi:integrase